MSEGKKKNPDNLGLAPPKKTHNERKRKHSHFRRAVEAKMSLVDHVGSEKIPKSFVFSRGKLPGSLKQLKLDLRKLMLPHTALKLKVKLSSCQRVLLLNYDKETRLINFRHYSIRLQPVGITRKLRKFVQSHQLPDLSNLCDVSEYITRVGYGSESEADEESSMVNLASDLNRVNHASTKSAVKLQEIGLRMTLQLVKVEEGLCSGDVIIVDSGGAEAKEHQKREE